MLVVRKPIEVQLGSFCIIRGVKVDECLLGLRRRVIQLLQESQTIVARNPNAIRVSADALNTADELASIKPRVNLEIPALIIAPDRTAVVNDT